MTASAPIDCKGTVCDPNCKVDQVLSFTDFMSTFNEEYPQTVGGRSLHMRSVYLHQLLVHSAYNVAHSAMHLTLGLDFIAAIAMPDPKEYNLRGWGVYSDIITSDEPFAWGISRSHRDRHSPNTETLVGRNYTRILGSTSEVTNMIIRDIHESHEHSLTAASSEYKSLQYGIYFPNTVKRFQTFATNCH